MLSIIEEELRHLKQVIELSNEKVLSLLFSSNIDTDKVRSVSSDTGHNLAIIKDSLNTLALKYTSNYLQLYTSKDEKTCIGFVQSPSAYLPTKNKTIEIMYGVRLVEEQKTNESTFAVVRYLPYNIFEFDSDMEYGILHVTNWQTATYVSITRTMQGRYEIYSKSNEHSLYVAGTIALDMDNKRVKTDLQLYDVSQIQTGRKILVAYGSGNSIKEVVLFPQTNIQKNFSIIDAGVRNIFENTIKHMTYEKKYFWSGTTPEETYRNLRKLLVTDIPEAYKNIPDFFEAFEKLKEMYYKDKTMQIKIGKGETVEGEFTTDSGNMWLYKVLLDKCKVKNREGTTLRSYPKPYQIILMGPANNPKMRTDIRGYADEFRDIKLTGFEYHLYPGVELYVMLDNTSSDAEGKRHYQYHIYNGDMYGLHFTDRACHFDFGNKNIKGSLYFPDMIIKCGEVIYRFRTRTFEKFDSLKKALNNLDFEYVIVPVSNRKLEDAIGIRREIVDRITKSIRMADMIEYSLNAEQDFTFSL